MKCLAHSEDSVNVIQWGGGAVDGGGAGSRGNYEESSLRLKLPQQGLFLSQNVPKV